MVKHPIDLDKYLRSGNDLSVSGVLTPGSTTLIKPLYPSSSSTSQQLTNMQFEVKNLWNGEECSEKPVKFNLKSKFYVSKLKRGFEWRSATY